MTEYTIVHLANIRQYTVRKVIRIFGEPAFLTIGVMSEYFNASGNTNVTIVVSLISYDISECTILTLGSWCRDTPKRREASDIVSHMNDILPCIASFINKSLK